MPLNEGDRAPDFHLPALDAGAFHLEHARRAAPVLLAFFKVSCPTCQYAFPFLERLHRAYPQAAVVGVSQDGPRETGLFRREVSLSLPLLLDPGPHYPVSNAYQVVYVPSLCLVAADGGILAASEAWERRELERCSRLIAQATNVAPAQIFAADEPVSDFIAGCAGLN